VHGDQRGRALRGVQLARVEPRARRHQRDPRRLRPRPDRKSTRLNSSHVKISYAVFCLKKKIKGAIIFSEKYELELKTGLMFAEDLFVLDYIVLFIYGMPRPPSPTLFPYTTLFRSCTRRSTRTGATWRSARSRRTSCPATPTGPSTSSSTT